MQIVPPFAPQRTDSSVNVEALVRFSLLSALSTQNDPPRQASKPFSKNRDGFVLAEGAGALVLESLEGATARGARILGVIAGCGELADSFHRTRSSPDGKPIIGCVRNALADAGMTPEQIDYINAHGTSTPLDDTAETRAVKSTFGAHDTKVAVSSTKSQLGHSLGATGGVEAVVLAMTISRNLMPPTINLDNPDPECDLDYVPHKARDRKIDVAMSNSFGFGGHNACIVMKKL
jgi:3-oxoacyl-[acyl-carrier-protein] synthase II